MKWIVKSWPALRRLGELRNSSIVDSKFEVRLRTNRGAPRRERELARNLTREMEAARNSWGARQKCMFVLDVDVEGKAGRVLEQLEKGEVLLRHFVIGVRGIKRWWRRDKQGHVRDVGIVVASCEIFPGAPPRGWKRTVLGDTGWW